jgi:hypothetical protein
MATGYGGTYKAVVMDNVDPMVQNRLMVSVPEVYRYPTCLEMM